MKVVGPYATGQEGVVIKIRDTRGDCTIEVKHGPQKETTYFRPSSLEVITPARAVPDEITIDGEKYRRVVEAKEPEKSEPKAGQVWQLNGRNLGRKHFFLLTDDGKNVALIGGGLGAWKHEEIGTYCDFVAPTLADALEQGLLKPSDLR